MLMLRLILDLFSPLLLCLVLSAGTLAQDNQAAKKTEAVQVPGGSSTVTGRAIYEDMGEPATRERVQLIESEALSNPPPARLRVPTAITNQNGEFERRGA